MTTVLIGKHVDKYEQDARRGIRTLPVILGSELVAPAEPGADDRVLPDRRRAGAARMLGPGVLLVVFAIPRL